MCSLVVCPVRRSTKPLYQSQECDPAYTVLSCTVPTTGGTELMASWLINASATVNLYQKVDEVLHHDALPHHNTSTPHDCGILHIHFSLVDRYIYCLCQLYKLARVMPPQVSYQPPCSMHHHWYKHTHHFHLFFHRQPTLICTFKCIGGFDEPILTVRVAFEAGLLC
jgi:hypothetical protein